MHLPQRLGASSASSRDGNSASDQELVRRIRSGDVSAFEAAFRRYYTPLCAFVGGYTKSMPSAEELVQDVFASIWQRHQHIEVTVSLQSYLYAAARNKALSHARRGQVERRWTEEVVRRQPGGESIDPAPTPESEFYAGELGTLVQLVVIGMPERRRLIYQLSRDRHMSYKEIAEVLEIAPKTVEIQIGRALKTIRDALRRAGWLT